MRLSKLEAAKTWWRAMHAAVASENVDEVNKLWAELGKLDTVEAWYCLRPFKEGGGDTYVKSVDMCTNEVDSFRFEDSGTSPCIRIQSRAIMVEIVDKFIRHLTIEEQKTYGNMLFYKRAYSEL